MRSQGCRSYQTQNVSTDSVLKKKPKSDSKQRESAAVGHSDSKGCDAPPDHRARRSRPIHPMRPRVDLHA